MGLGIYSNGDGDLELDTVMECVVLAGSGVQPPSTLPPSPQSAEEVEEASGVTSSTPADLES